MVWLIFFVHMPVLAVHGTELPRARDTDNGRNDAREQQQEGDLIMQM